MMFVMIYSFSLTSHRPNIFTGMMFNSDRFLAVIEFDRLSFATHVYILFMSERTYVHIMFLLFGPKCLMLVGVGQDMT
jgi:hypothetical protein